MFKKIFSSLFIGLFLFSGVVNAHSDVEEQIGAGMLPNNPLYFLETLWEGFGDFLIFNEVKKSERFFHLAEERLAEAQELAGLGDSDNAQKSMERYEKYLLKAIEKTEKAKGRGENTDEVLSKIAEGTVKHQTKLAEVYEKVDEEAKDAIEHAMEEGMKGHDRAIRALSEEKHSELIDELDQLLEEIDVELEELNIEGAHFPEIKDREHDEMEDKHEDLFEELEHESEYFDDLEDLDYEIEDGLDDLIKDLENLI